MGAAYYNEIDLHAAQWLRNLIAAGHIADGVVDTRSIEDVQPDDLREFAQCHFFAGIGVWSYALRAAGWPDDRPVWTGSCPCQPFSAAGEGLAFADERHLWPAFHHLIKERRPAIVVGEQVASKAVDAWIDLVHADLEAVGYTFGSVPFPSAGVGAPHIRDRNYWVGVGLADANHARLEGRQFPAKRSTQRSTGASVLAGWLGNSVGADGERDARSISGAEAQIDRSGLSNGSVVVGSQYAGTGILRMANADMPKQDGGRTSGGQQSVCDEDSATCKRDGASPTNGWWRDADWLGCSDGLWRPVEPGAFPLAHGVAGRMGKLRAYGNAINAEAARVFIECVMEAA
jgi:DNA (cytosine-5)-methyltransferase 1